MSTCSKYGATDPSGMEGGLKLVLQVMERHRWKLSKRRWNAAVISFGVWLRSKGLMRGP
jgi:hypothetical protein